MNSISTARFFQTLSGVILLALHALCGAIAAAEPPLQSLARSHFDSGQGVLVKSEDNTILAALNPERPFHPASVTKVASTLAFLHRWGPDRRLRTKLLGRDRIEKGVLYGDMIIQSEGDPYFVFENAFLTLLELHALGLRRVQGDIRVTGPFFFNWSPDPRGRRFKQALSGEAGSKGWDAVKAHRRETKGVALTDISLEFGGGRAGPQRGDELLLIHDSAPLQRLLKEFNGYSNNIFHVFSHLIGGARVVETVARTVAPEKSQSLVRIDNAAGGGRTNRLTPSAAVAILEALERELASNRLSLRDVLPVAGVDQGTLESRLDTGVYRGAVVGKTGTLPSIAVSALAGVAHTKRYGRVFFAIFNKGLPIWQARQKQDAFVADLLDRAHPAPPPYRPARAPAFTEARIHR